MVDPIAYAALGKTQADQGSSTYVFHSPLNLPILEQSAAKNLITKEKLENRTIYLGGYSLGEVVASRVAKELGIEHKCIRPRTIGTTGKSNAAIEMITGASINTCNFTPIRISLSR